MYISASTSADWLFDWLVLGAGMRHGVTEGLQHLPDIDQNSTCGFDLTIAVVAQVTGFWSHRAAAQAGLSLCWRMASAASSPLPPTCAEST